MGGEDVDFRNEWGETVNGGQWEQREPRWGGGGDQRPGRTVSLVLGSCLVPDSGPLSLCLWLSLPLFQLPLPRPSLLTPPSPPPSLSLSIPLSPPTPHMGMYYSCCH